MSRTAKPALITLALSVAAVLGYVAYRVTLGSSAPQPHSHDGGQLAYANALPDISLVNLDGELQSIATLEGRPLVLNFWATWCAPCLREIPMLKAFQDEHPWLTVVGIAIDTQPEVEAFAEEMQFNYPILIGRNEGVNAAGSFGVDFHALPFTVFTDAEGRTLGVHTGELHAEHLDNLRAVLEDVAAGRAGVEEARARLAGLM